MKLTQIRNATVLLEYGGVRFLIDPMLSPKGALPPCHSRVRPEARNPLCDLPCPVETLLDVDAVIVTHLHPGHFDQAAAQLLSKNKPVFVQNARDREALGYYGFQQVTGLEASAIFSGVTLTKIPGRYGNWEEEMLDRMGSVCGVMFQAPVEPCLYATGDTVWYPGVEHAVREFLPQVVLANAGRNMGWQHQSNMGKDDVFALYQAVPSALIVATHMEDLNHWTLSRHELQDFARRKGFLSQLRTPINGESISISSSQMLDPMKNEGNILPLAKGSRVAVIGEFARKDRYQGPVPQ